MVTTTRRGGFFDGGGIVGSPCLGVIEGIVGDKETEMTVDARWREQDNKMLPGMFSV